MLSKSYSTLALLFASNVLDGGKDFNKVPDQLKSDVKDLIKSVEDESSNTATNSLGKEVAK